MSRAELAEALNAYLSNRGVNASLTYKDIARYERGDSRWPRAHYRRGLRAVLGAETDAQLGLFNTRRSPSSEEPLRADDSGGGAVEAADWWVAGTVAPPVVSLSPELSRRVVLHWTGRKAYALRIAMRLSIYDFTAKLGVSLTAVRDWREGSTGSLRFETHRMLDTLLLLASDDELLRFDLALQEIGESR